MNTTTKGQLSVWRLSAALLTVGLSLPFLGIRKPVGRSKVLRTKGGE
jgi:hypothetical protein